MRYIINVNLKPDMVDPQGQVIKEVSTTALGYEGIVNVRVGKTITIEADQPVDVDKLCTEMLVNEIIENYQLTVEE